MVAGYVYCAVAALSLVDRPSGSAEAMSKGIESKDNLLKFLAGRQMAYLPEDEDDSDEDDGENFVQASLEAMTLEETRRLVGFNGRWNKKADSCYPWWVTSTLQVCWNSPGI